MPSISIVVPVLNEAATIEQFLQELRARVGAAEILLVDGGSRDEARERAAVVCDRLLSTKSSRALQMNAGAEARWFWSSSPPDSMPIETLVPIAT